MCNAVLIRGNKREKERKEHCQEKEALMYFIKALRLEAPTIIVPME